MRPRSATNSVELTPAALSSGIASAEAIAAESVAARPGSPVGSASGISWVPDAVAIVERGRHVGAAGRSVGQIGRERSRRSPRSRPRARSG